MSQQAEGQAHTWPELKAIAKIVKALGDAESKTDIVLLGPITVGCLGQPMGEIRRMSGGGWDYYPIADNRRCR